MSYLAELDENNIVKRVIVCDDIQWASDKLGGTWVETSDPYSEEEQQVSYCGPGFGYDDSFPEKFAAQWKQPVATDEGWTYYQEGELVFHNGRIWRSTTPNNVWEPGVSGWHDSPLSGVPLLDKDES